MTPDKLERYLDSPIAEVAELAAEVMRLRSVPAAVPGGWISVEDRLPAIGQTVLVWSKQSWEKEPSLKIDCWDEQREAPVSFSSETIPVGPGWDEHDDFYQVTHWLPLPAAPNAAPTAPTAEALPPLPVAKRNEWPHGWADLYTSGQMRAYGQACAAAMAGTAPAPTGGEEINRQLLEALRDAVAALGGVNSDNVPESARAAIAAAKEKAE